MARPEESVKDDVEMKEPLHTNGKLELKYSPLEQETHLSRSEVNADNQNLENGLHQRGMGYKHGCCLRAEAMLRKMPYSTITAIILGIILAIALAISVSFNIKQNVELKELQNNCNCPVSLCPSNWTMDGETCYYFSDTQQTWNCSQSYCSLYGGSLITNHSNQEWDFIKKHRRRAETWINLKRNNLTEPWKWPNGSLVDSRIGGEGFCAYLNERGASSTLCDLHRHWICSKPISHT